MNPDFYAFLQTQPTITQKIADRVYPQVIPQHLFEGDQIMPCLVWRRLGVERQQTLCGTDDLINGTFEFISWAPSYDDACALADALAAILIDYRGLMGAVPVGPVLLNTDTDREPEPIPGLFLVSQVFTVWYREPSS